MGHKRDECWSLSGRPEKKQPRRTKQNVGKGKQVNITVKARGVSLSSQQFLMLEIIIKCITMTYMESYE